VGEKEEKKRKWAAAEEVEDLLFSRQSGHRGKESRQQPKSLLAGTLWRTRGPIHIQHQMNK
jgi:hypothetical protein